MDEAPERRPMDTPLLASVAVGGGVLGLLSSFGLLAGVLELVAWVVLSTATLIAVLRRIPQDAFRHAAFALTIAGFVGGDVKAVLWQRFLATHADFVDRAAEQGAETVTRTAVIISDTVTGVLFGLMTGAMAWYLVRRTAGRADTDA